MNCQPISCVIFILSLKMNICKLGSKGLCFDKKVWKIDPLFSLNLANFSQHQSNRFGEKVASRAMSFSVLSPFLNFYSRHRPLRNTLERGLYNYTKQKTSSVSILYGMSDDLITVHSFIYTEVVVKQHCKGTV